MKTFIECIPCFIKQSLQAAKIASDDPDVHRSVLNEVARMIPEINPSDCPPKMGKKIHEVVKKKTGNKDPYKRLKDKYNRIALSLYPFLKEKVKDSEDGLLTACRIAIAGNVIDFGAQLDFSLDKDLNDVLYRDFGVNDYKELIKALENERKILYLGDNAGETVFDRVLIEEIKNRYGSEVTYAVKEEPIINDATMEDALFAGIDKTAKIISSGSDAPGTVLEYCSPEFREMFERSGLIISKGQGNFEALSAEKRPLFFLLKIKCDVLADYMGLLLGSIILSRGWSK